MNKYLKLYRKTSYFLEENKVAVSIFLLVVLAVFFYATCGAASFFTFDDPTFAAVDPSLSSAASYSLHYGNGRFLGNITAIWLCNFAPLRIVVKTGVAVGLMLLLIHLFEIKELLPRIFFVIYYLYISYIVCSDVFSWTSGFCNFTLPIFFLVILLLIIKKAKKVTVVKGFTIFVIGFALELFVEHYSAIFIMLGLILLVYSHKKNDKPRFGLYMIWLFGALLGAFVMYLIPVCFEATVELGMSVADYRTWTDEFKSTLFATVFDRISDLLIIPYTIVPIFYLGKLLFSKEEGLTVKEQFKAHKKLAIAIIIYFLCYLVAQTIALITDTSDTIVISNFEIVFNAIFALVFLFTFVEMCFSIHSEFKKDRISSMIFLMILLSVSSTPIVLASYVSFRCFLLTYLTITYMCTCFFGDMIKGIDFIIEEGRFDAS